VSLPPRGLQGSAIASRIIIVIIPPLLHAICPLDSTSTSRLLPGAGVS